MSKESRWPKADRSKFNQNQQQKLEEIADKLVEDEKYRVEFLKNPESFIEAEAKIKVDDNLMKIVWESVHKLSDQTGQPRKGRLQGVTLD